MSLVVVVVGHCAGTRSPYSLQSVSNSEASIHRAFNACNVHKALRRGRTTEICGSLRSKTHITNFYTSGCCLSPHCPAFAIVSVEQQRLSAQQKSYISFQSADHLTAPIIDPGSLVGSYSQAHSTDAALTTLISESLLCSSRSNTSEGQDY